MLEYRLRVLPRPPNAAERAIAPEEDSPPANNRTPPTFRADHPELLATGH
jgi:hypothetical protein